MLVGRLDNIRNMRYRIEELVLKILKAGRRPMVDQTSEVAFGPYRLDTSRRTLRHGQRFLDVGGRALDILIILYRAEGETVSRRVLLDQVWPGLMIEDNNLYVQISMLRKTLGDGWIVTVPRRGYRLVGATTSWNQG